MEIRSRAQVARPQLGRRGQLRSTEAEIAITTAFLRRAFSICTVKGKAGGVGGRSSGFSGQEESSCSAGEVVQETKTGSCSLYKTRKKYSQKGPDPLA